MNDAPTHGVALLAAGSSSRMGRPKLLLPWGDTTVLGQAIARWRATSARTVAVVMAAGDVDLEAELRRLAVPEADWIRNPEPGAGMLGSIRRAAGWAGWPPGTSHVAIALGDQPLVTVESLQRLAREAAGQPDVLFQPSHHGRPRHPVFVPAGELQALARFAGPTFREFLAQRPGPRRLVVLEDPGLEQDLDTPADYAELRRRWAG